MICYAISQLFAAYFFTNTNTMFVHFYCTLIHVYIIIRSFVHTHTNAYIHAFHALACCFTSYFMPLVLAMMMYSFTLVNLLSNLYVLRSVVHLHKHTDRPTASPKKSSVVVSHPIHVCVCVYRGVCTV